MASTLAAQLQAAKALQGDAPGAKKVRGKPSLLFDFQKAADVDLQTLYEIGCQGLDELVRKDPRYATLREALFSRAAASLARDQLTADAVAKLDAAVAEFCGLLSQHFLAPGAFKALEYLIRRFRVHEHNVEPLLLAALPYHATNEFVRLLQVLALDPNRGRFSWLARAQGPGAALPREVLVARCINDPVVLAFICEGAKQLGSKARQSKAYLSFYAATLCEVIASVQEVGEGLVSLLLPFISSGLDAGACADYRAATLMVVAELSGRVRLGKDFVKAIVNSMLRHMEPGADQLRTVLLVLAHLSVTQPHVSSLPDKALKALLAAPSVVPELQALATANVRVGPLLALFSSTLASKLPNGYEVHETAMLQLVHTGLLEPVAKGLALKLLRAAAESAKDAPGRRAVLRVLRALDLRYPTQMDAAVNEALAPLRAAQKQRQGAGGAEQGSSSEEEDEAAAAAGSQPSEAAQAVYAVVKEAMAHSARAPCSDCALTLAAAAVAPAARVRKMALSEVSTLLEKEGLAGEARAQLQSCLLTGLQDESLEVVETVMALSAVAALPPAALLPALQSPLRRVAGLLMGASKDAGTKSSLKAARGAARKALSLLASVAASSGNQEVQDAALLLVLQYALPVPRAPRVSKAAVAAAKQLDHPLARALAGLQEQAAALSAADEQEVASPEDGPAAESKTKGKGKGGKKDKAAAPKPVRAADKWAAKALQKEKVAAAAHVLERAAVEAVAKAVAASPDTQVQEVARLMEAARQAAAQQPQDDGSHPGGDVGLLHARHLLLLSLNAVLSKAAARASARPQAASASATTARTLVSVALKELACLPAAAPGSKALGDWQATASECLDASALPQPTHAQALEASPTSVHGAILCHALAAALAACTDLSLGPEAASPEQGTLAFVAATFQELGALQPAGAFDGHLQQLLLKGLPDAEARVQFLASVFASPSGLPAPVQCTALRLLARMAAGPAGSTVASTPAKSVSSRASSASAAAAAAPTAATLLRFIPHLLAATANSHASVRAAALEALHAAAAALDSASGQHPACGPVAQLVRGLQAHAKLVQADPEAGTVLLRNTLHGSAAEAAAAPAEAPTPARKGKASKAAESQGTAKGAAPLVAQNVAQAAYVHLAHLLADCVGSSHDANAARTLLSVLLPETVAGSHTGAAVPATVDQRTALAQAATSLLKALLARAPSPLEAIEQQVAAVIASALFTATIASEHASADAPTLLLQLLACIPSSPSAPASATPAWFASCSAARLATLVTLQQGPPDVLQSHLARASSGLPRALFQSLVTCAQGDASDSCRVAARSVLEVLSVSHTVVVPLLQAAVPVAPADSPSADGAAPTPAKKKARGRAAAAAATAPATPAASQPAVPAPGTLELAALVLELLQWKEVAGLEHVAAAAQSLLAALQHSLAPITESYGPEDEEGDEAAAAHASAAQAAGKSSLAGYTAQLILSFMEQAAKAAAAPGAGKAGKELVAYVDLGLVVGVAQAAPDAGVRNAALSLLAVMAMAMPEAVLDHVLQVLAVVHASTVSSSDHYSQRVAITTLASVVPAWLAAGKELSALWSVLVAALPSLPPHRRFSLLNALLSATPEEDSLPVGLLLLIKAATASLLAAPPKPKGKDQARGDEQQPQEQEHEWMLELAAQLCLQVAPPARLRCLAALLPLSVDAAAGVPYDPLPRAATTFVSTQLQAKSVAAARALGGDTDSELQRGCEALMQQALSKVQSLADAHESLATGQQPTAIPTEAAAAPKSAKKGKAGKGAAAPAPAAAGSAVPLTGVALHKAERAVRASIEAVYGLFGALQGVMDSASYLQALLRLAEQPGNAVRRRALRLFADKADTLAAELDAITKHPALTAKAREASRQRLLTAALKICSIMAATDGPAALHSGSALTKQAGLIAFASTVTAAGAFAPAAVLQALPSVLALVKDENAAVRGSALAAIAAVVRACGAQAVPLLPKVAAAVVEAAKAACKALQAGPAASAADKAADKASGTPSKHSGKDQEEDEEEGTAATGSEAVAVELAAALSAIDALIASLGPFLSPYIPSLLHVLLHPAVLGCVMAGCAPAAAAARARLPKTVPARLLMQPLFGALPDAMEAGAEACAALLSLVADAATGMEAAVAATHHEAIFAFILRALDVRQSAPAALKGHEHVVEQQAVAALVALTLKLSESKFKPLFLRLAEWGTSTGSAAAAPSAQNVGRTIALLSAAAALATKLRSVFVPYFRYLVEPCVVALTGAAADGAPKKKKQKAVAVATVDSSAIEAEERWVLRAKALRALHRCFLYDTVGWVDADKVDRLLSPLVAQLSAEPPASAVALIQAQAADAELDGILTLGKRAPRDTYGVAAAAALVQLAMAANSDVYWKPLNHQVLMATRSPSARTRALALEVVAALVDRLREEYMTLLPETLPFLAELLEDVDTAVESRAQDILRSLEEISGEKLDSYLKT